MSSLFFVPYTQPAFKHTVETSIDLTSLSISDDVLQEIPFPKEARVWGAKDSERNQNFFDQMKSGDPLLFYHNGKFQYYGELGVKFRNTEIADEYWNGINASMIYSVVDLISVDIDRRDVNTVLGYEECYKPVSLHRVNNQGYWKLRREFSSVKNYVSTIDGTS